MLAPNVELVGEMQGSGFEDRQWLIQRDGRFIQLTELLYRVAEQANGKRTLEEIAARVTEATEWLVSADDVQHLVRTKLLPLGLIAATDGSVVVRREEPPRSPLQVNMRRRLLSPRVLDAITRVLQVLYAPPVLLPVLIAIAVAHGWLYLVHGADRSLLYVLSTPWLLLVVLPIVVVSAMFHELGHAAGLRYGGGKVRGMGTGFYLIYPTFYTDTTDSYRLGRWARLRTDLGGFYFHLIFALGVIALYLVYRQEFLLVVVLLINLDILYQLLPHMRLDGYWTLADLTGIPDLFSQVGPFLRSVLPAPGSEGSKLPRLKPWVRAAFVAYIVLALPALGLLMLLIVANVPLVITTTWDSFLNVSRELSNAQNNGHVVEIATSLVQMLILALPMLGVAYFLYSLTWNPMRGLWDWSKPSPTRRIAGALGTAAVVGVVGFMWFPWLPFSALPSGPADSESFVVTERSHVRTPVAYPQNPPVGGNHAPIWQNCGFYDAPVGNENAVHSLEHGAVWITYRPDLPSEQVEALRNLAHRQDHILVSAYPDLPAPVVASAWGKQLRLDSADDPRLDEFVRAFRLGRQAPEVGGPCDGGLGQPG